MIKFFNCCRQPINIIYENDSQTVLPNDCIEFSPDNSFSFLVEHCFESSIHTKGGIFKTYIADIVLNSEISISSEMTKEDVLITVTEQCIPAKNPRNLNYICFSFDKELNVNYTVAGRDKVEKDIKRLEHKNNLLDVLWNIIIFIVLEPFFLLAYIFTDYKLIFLILMIMLAVFIVVYTLASNKSHKRKQKEKGIASFADGIDDGFIKAFFNNYK